MTTTAAGHVCRSAWDESSQHYRCPTCHIAAHCPCPSDGISGDCMLHSVTPQTVDNLLAEIEAAPIAELTTQQELLTALDELLDNALHTDECFITPDDTVCKCLIGKVRDQLPVCGQTKAMALSGTDPARVWTCTRAIHPSSPDRHVFEVI